jgi:hypothetical protein
MRKKTILLSVSLVELMGIEEEFACFLAKFSIQIEGLLYYMDS